MNKEELDYCIQEFNEAQAYIFKNGLKVSLLDVCKEIKELREENQQLKSVLNEARDYIKIYTNDYTEKLEMIEILYLLEILERGKE